MMQPRSQEPEHAQMDSHKTNSEHASQVDESTPGPDLVQSRERELLRRLIITVVILGALIGLFFTGRAATTGLDSTSDALPAQVDRLIPASGAQVLRQSQVGIDVADGYDAYLIINGVNVRDVGDGLIRDLGTGLILLQPGPGKAVETLNEGKNCVVAMVWDKLKNPSSAVPVSWCFDAT